MPAPYTHAPLSLSDAVRREVGAGEGNGTRRTTSDTPK